jgi:transposase InsO family protein
MDVALMLDRRELFRAANRTGVARHRLARQAGPSVLALGLTAWHRSVSILPDAETVIALLPAWFEDYNEVHPHSGLKFLSTQRISAPRCLAQPATCSVKRGAHHLRSCEIGQPMSL